MNSVAGLINRRSAFVASAQSLGLHAALDIPRTVMFNTHFFSRLRERVHCYDYAGAKR